MPEIKPPIKPFPKYKWRWAVLTPTESLNDPPIFLGVLRVFNRFQGYAPSSKRVIEDLSIVEKETNSPVNLARSEERNLLRNSGQYWRALGLLEEAHGIISVSAFGKLLAEGKITQVEFATTVIKTLELPNRNIEDPTEWDAIGLRIKPLQLILTLISLLNDNFGPQNAFITPNELTKIIIPLAGSNNTSKDYINTIIQYRQESINISNWPDCTPSSNDKRMAREFLIFLSNYGFLKRERHGYGNENEHYVLASISKSEIIELNKLKIANEELVNIVRKINITQIPANIERKRVSREVLERPYQTIFRKNILEAFNFTCVITNVRIDNVLEASHIVPISEKGSDLIENGLCLRSDIHQLFDSGHLRLLPNGEILLSEIASSKNNYGTLPKKIQIPAFVDKEYLNWRVKYY